MADLLMIPFMFSHLSEESCSRHFWTEHICRLRIRVVSCAIFEGCNQKSQVGARSKLSVPTRPQPALRWGHCLHLGRRQAGYRRSFQSDKARVGSCTTRRCRVQWLGSPSWDRAKFMKWPSQGSLGPVWKDRETWCWHASFQLHLGYFSGYATPGSCQGEPCLRCGNERRLWPGCTRLGYSSDVSWNAFDDFHGNTKPKSTMSEARALPSYSNPKDT